MFVEANGPIDSIRASIRAPLRITVCSARAGAPVPSTTRACVSARIGAFTDTNGASADESDNGCCACTDAIEARSAAPKDRHRRVAVFIEC
jgi:hypothetical protein